MGEVKDLQKEKERLAKQQSEKKEKEKEEKKEEKDIKPKEVPLAEMSKEELIKKIEEEKQNAKKYFDLYLRAHAEIENMKKRFQKEREELIRFGNESLIKELLTVVDNLERAVAHSQERESATDSVNALTEGVKLTLKGLKDVLKKAGLEEFSSLGKKFDPNYHYAVEQKKDPSVEDGTVIKELQKGYILNGRLLRPAMVVVSKKE